MGSLLKEVDPRDYGFKKEGMYRVGRCFIAQRVVNCPRESSGNEAVGLTPYPRNQGLVVAALTYAQIALNGELYATTRGVVVKGDDSFQFRRTLALRSGKRVETRVERHCPRKGKRTAIREILVGAAPHVHGVTVDDDLRTSCTACRGPTVSRGRRRCQFLWWCRGRQRGVADALDGGVGRATYRVVQLAGRVEVARVSQIIG